MTRLTPSEVCQRTGATYRQLDYWCRQGWLHPDRVGYSVNGSGSPRDWPLSEIRAARTMARLVAAGLSPPVAAEVARGRVDIGDGIRVVVT
jgi:hypothetical protein